MNLCKMINSWYSCLLLAILSVTTGSGSFIVRPSDQEPVEGSQLSITCTSDDGVFIVWYKDENIIASNEQHFTQTNSVGGSSSILNIESVDHQLHTGQYACVAVFRDSSSSTAPFSITVKYINENVGIQLNTTSKCSCVLMSGCGLSLKCYPPSGYPSDVRVTWFRNGAEMYETTASDVGSRIVLTENKTMLVINSVIYEDSGWYQCRASNGLGITRHSTIINITIQADGRGLRFITSSGRDNVVAVNEGTQLALNCSVVDAIGSVSFQWQIQNESSGSIQDIVNDGERLQVNSTTLYSSVLLIDVVTLTDEGLYLCTAADYLTNIKRNFTVNIEVPRAIIEWPPSEVYGTIGEKMKFDCVASGHPLPTVIWFFQSAPVTTTSDLGLQDLGNGSLLIQSLLPHHSGTYLCMLKEPPLDIHSFTLTVSNTHSPSLQPTPSVQLQTADGHTFTIGSLNEIISMVTVVGCGLVTLSVLFCSIIIIVISIYCSYQKKRFRRNEEKTLQKQREGCNGVHISGIEHSRREGEGREGNEKEVGSSMTRIFERRLPLPPEPKLEEDEDEGQIPYHYEEIDDIMALDLNRGITRPRLPSFSMASDISDTVITELETVMSAATDTQLVTSS